ncbi:MAG: transposase [Propionibacteriaceae bacterium]|nr:transposase [Propionibacteriaceae bacterium]
MRLVLASLRHNLEQESLAELFDISHPTVSRVLTVSAPLIAAALADNVPTTDDLDPDPQLIIDCTLIPCWAWRDKPELYFGTHHTTGLNLQVACTLTGHLAWLSDPLPGRTHDARALTGSGLLHRSSDSQSNNSPRYPLTRHIADKGYVGMGHDHPVKNQPDYPNQKPTRTTIGPPTQSDSRSNKTIANLKPDTPSKRLQTPH